MKFFDVLHRYRDYENRLWSINQQIKELRQTGGLPRTKDIVISAHNKGDISVVFYLDKINELNGRKVDIQQALDNLRNDLERFLDRLEDYWVRQVVELRLLYHRNSWKVIADRLNYSVSTVRRLYHDGLNELETMEL